MDLVEYARRVQGYEVRAQDGGRGIVMLEHPALRDRVAMAQAADGRWLFAGVPDYTPRAPGEFPEQALARLRDCIGRSASRGSFMEFERHAEALRRQRSAEMLRDAQAGRELSADALRQLATVRRIASSEPALRPEEPGARPRSSAEPAPRMVEPSRPDSARDLRNRRIHGVVPSLDGEGSPTPEQIAARKRDFESANRSIDAIARPPPPRRPGHVEMFAAFDLVEYARREQGYDVRPRDGGAGITVLENVPLRDRVAIARTQDGRWIFADVRAYVPRAPDEPVDTALARLRDCIGRSPSQGSVVEFAVRADGMRQELTAARSGPSPHGLAHVPMVGAAAGRHPLGIRHYDLKPVALDGPPLGRERDRGR